MSKDIKCKKCGWEWDKKDSDLRDMYVCHKCGFNNTSLYNENVIKGGLADGKSIVDLAVHHGNDDWASIQFESLEAKLKKALEQGIKVEMEHTDNKEIAHEIAMDHLWEDPDYYTKLKKVEESTLKIGIIFENVIKIKKT